MPLLSVRAYARHRAELGLPGTSHTAVQKAAAAGRIHLTPDGKVDSDEADRLWAARTDEGHRRNPGQEPAARAPAKKAAPEAGVQVARRPRLPPPPAAPPADGEDPGGPVPDYQESRARREAAEAGLAELELAQEQAKLLPSADVEARLVGIFSQCKTKLLGIPSRARQQDPALTVEQLALLESLIREACSALAVEPPQPVKVARTGT